MNRNFKNKMLVTLCVCGVTLSTLPPMTVQGNETNVPPAMEALTATPSYDAVFRIANGHIKSIQNNAGNYGNSVIAKAIDGNPNTHWETNKPNSNSFHNVVTVALDDVYEISSLKYQARQDAGAKGFPLQYKLSYSTSESGNDWKPLKEGSFASVTTQAVSIAFEPTQMRRIQFEFVQANADWASMAELSFYRYDALSARMNEIFTDGTYARLNEAYENQAVLDELQAQAETHPRRAEFSRLLQDAQTLLDQPGAFDDRIVTASQRGNVAKEKNRTQMYNGLFAFDSTGYYVTPGETIYVYVEADPKGVMPQLVFGQIANDKGGWHRKINLTQGLNVITAQTMDKMNPAAIYINNEALPGDQAYAPRIRVSGGTKFPLYVHGVTDTKTFQSELEAYLKNVSYEDSDFENGNPRGYYYNIAEIITDNTTITTSAAGALNEVKAIVKSGSSVEEKMDAWENMYFTFARYSGYDMEDESSPNYRPRGKFMARVFSRCPYGFADYGYTGYLGGEPFQRASGFYASLISAPASGGWAVYHEIGHIYDNNRIGLSESTNNLYSLLLQDIYQPGNNRMIQENRWEGHFTKYHNTKVYPDDQLFYGAIVYQLQAVYGNELYGNAQAITRSNPNGVLDGLSSNNDRMAVSLSLGAGADLTGHFDYYGKTVSPLAKSRVAHLPVAEKKTYYVNDKSFAADATAFTTEAPQPRLDVTLDNGTSIKLSMEEPKTAILCYEIYRDGVLLGVTYSDSFKDSSFEANKTHSYTAIAYDRKLNPSKVSTAVVANPSQPMLKVPTLTTVALGSNFDPMAYVSAKDVQGENIFDRVNIVENTVDTTKRGNYSITYEVTDAMGNSTKTTMPVTVASTVTYLSDLQETGGKVEWGKLTKDLSPGNTPLSLYDGIGERVFAKGLGAHANSEIVYQIEGQNYAYFEASLGIDKYDREATAASATYEIWVDGKLAYESGIFRCNSPMEQVQVEIAGAKEIKLITTTGGNNNYGDMTIWADAKFVTLDSKPVITVSDHAFLPGDEISVEALAAEATAYDAEDGDLSGQIQYSSNYIPGQSGAFEIVYTVRDSDGNETQAVSNLAVVNDFIYASDVSWKSATSGWKSVSKDLAVSGAPLSLLGEDGVVTYEKGIGTHAASQIVYDLTGKDYQFFSGYVGVDRSGGNHLSSIVYHVYVDGVLVKETDLMKYNDPQQLLLVNIAGAKELKLVVTDGGNGNANDHAAFGDAKFLTAVKKVDKQALHALNLVADGIVNEQYTAQSWQAFTKAKAQAIALLADESASQEAIDAATVQLQEAIDGLTADERADELRSVIAFARAMTDVSYVDPTLSHGQTRWENLLTCLAEANDLLMQTDTTQEQIDRYTYLLGYFIDETGQTYAPNTTPTTF